MQVKRAVVKMARQIPEFVLWVEDHFPDLTKCHA
jgi:hypothetical protein